MTDRIEERPYLNELNNLYHDTFHVRMEAYRDIHGHDADGGYISGYLAEIDSVSAVASRILTDLVGEVTSEDYMDSSAEDRIRAFAATHGITLDGTAE